MTASAVSGQRWLVVKLADIGDLLTITPTLQRLRDHDPAGLIHVLATGHSAPILQDSGLADEVLVFDKFAFDRPGDLLHPANWQAGIALARALRQGHYDHVLILHHLTTRFGALKYTLLALASGAPKRVGLDNGRGWFLTRRVPDGGFGASHEAAYWLQVADAALGDLSAPHTPKAHPLRVGISPADREWAAERLAALEGPRIAIHPGSGGYSLARRWSPEGFAAVADALHAQLGAAIVLVGGPGDDAQAVAQAMAHRPLDLTGQTTLNQLAAVLAECDLFIGADSGVMHLATAAGTRVVAIFGPSNAAAWGPWAAPERARVVRSAPLCSPCSYVLRTVGQREGCPARTCMQMVTPAQVVETATGLLRGDPPPPAPPAWTPALQPEERVRMLGVPLDPITWAALHDLLRGWIAGDRPRQICTVNPEFIMVARQDIHFYTILQRADLCAADGIGLLIAARLRGLRLPDRITGSDGLPKIASWAAEEGWKLFLLGAAEGVAERAASMLRARHPDLQIVGTYAGSPAPEDEDAIVARVNASKADILFVAYGAPRQDKWIARNLPRLQVKVAMGVGGAIDFVTGAQVRAPLGWQRLGLEWLYRLFREPWRWKRMLRLPRFVLAVLRHGPHGPARFEGPRGM
jgi:exopolysaccharide biosynthesis WecB/TagA/CpsF family protein